MHAKTDVCVMDRRSGIILLVQEDKRLLGGGDPEPQLFAEAVAAFQFHNRQLRPPDSLLSISQSFPHHHDWDRSDILQGQRQAALVECIETAQYQLSYQCAQAGASYPATSRTAGGRYEAVRQ